MSISGVISLAFLSLSESRLLLPLMSRFRRFSSAFKSITLSSDNLRTPASTGPTSGVDESDMFSGCENVTVEAEGRVSLSLPRAHSPDYRQNTINSVSQSKQNGAVHQCPAHASALGFQAHARKRQHGQGLFDRSAGITVVQEGFCE